MELSILKFKKVSIISMLLLAAVAFKANAQQVIGLQKAVDLALQNNLTIKQAQVTESIGTLDYQQSKNNLLPGISANPQAGYNFGRSPVAGQYAYANQASFSISASASVQMTLFQGGALRNQILQNRLFLDVDKTNTAKVKNDLVLSVVTTYLTILTNQDLVVAAKQQIDLAKLTLDRSQKNVNAGNQTMADLAQSQALLSTAEYNLTTAQNQYDLSLLTLKQYMEIDPNTDIAVEKPDITKINEIQLAYNGNEVIKTAFTINPDIKLAELQQQTYAQAIKIAQAAYYPTLSLFGNLQSSYSNAVSQRVTGATTPALQQIGTVQGTNQPVYSLQPTSQPIYTPGYPFTNQFGDNFNQSIGLSLQIPIFSRFLAHTNVKKAKLNYQNAELSTQIAKNNLSKTISQAILDLSASDKKYQSALKTFQANKEALNVITQRYNVGLVNSLDYNTSITNFNKAQNDMILARYEVIFRSKVIDYYLGNPIAL